MPGIINVTNVSIEDITQIANFTNPAEMMVYVNHVIYEGWAFYLLFWLLAIVLFIAAQKYRKEPLNNALYAFGIVSVISIFARAVQAYILGDYVALLTDYQFWTFPLLTSLIGGIIWANKKF